MTLAPFADIDALINQGCAATLANGRASYKGGLPFNVIFERAPADSFDGTVNASARTCAFEAALAPGIAEGHELQINGMVFLVSSGAEPDETGWVELRVFPKA